MQTVVRTSLFAFKLSTLKPLLVDSFNRWSSDKVARLSAAISFFAVLSLSPLLVLAVAIAGSILGVGSVQHHLYSETRIDMGAQAAQFIGSLIDSATRAGAGYVAGAISIVVALYAASNLFLQLDDAINTIWRIKPDASAVKGFFLARLISILMVLGFSVIVFAWVVLDSWLGWVVRHTGGYHLLRFVSIFASFFFLLGVCAMAYRSLPRGVLTWRDVWPGAIVSALGIVLAKLLLSLYFAYSGVSSAYGSAGALVVILLWTYYTTQIFLFGIELTYVYAHAYGSKGAVDDPASLI